jgi:hypothetical protein
MPARRIEDAVGDILTSLLCEDQWSKFDTSLLGNIKFPVDVQRIERRIDCIPVDCSERRVTVVTRTKASPRRRNLEWLAHVILLPELRECCTFGY